MSLGACICARARGLVCGYGLMLAHMCAILRLSPSKASSAYKSSCEQHQWHTRQLSYVYGSSKYRFIRQA
eukprot:5987601-Pleurochrysis_carterae.AAC.1